MKEYSHINRCIQDFADHYKTWLLKNIPIDTEDAIISFLSLLNAVRQTPYRLYRLIDEYDNFANDLRMGQGEINPARYKTLLYFLRSARRTLHELSKAARRSKN